MLFLNISKTTYFLCVSREPPFGGRTGADAFGLRMTERSYGSRRDSSLQPKRIDGSSKPKAAARVGRGRSAREKALSER